jgi:hypothetical protein
MKVDFYACRQEDGTVNYDDYEKALAARENEDAQLLNKIRRGVNWHVFRAPKGSGF